MQNVKTSETMFAVWYLAPTFAGIGVRFVDSAEFALEVAGHLLVGGVVEAWIERVF